MTMTSEVKLEPCPHCGGQAKMISGGPGNHYVRCTTCAAQTTDGAADRMAANWNRRVAVSEEPTAEEIERVKTAIFQAVNHFISPFNLDRMARAAILAMDRRAEPEGDWRVKDYADGWCWYRTEKEARESDEAENGARVEFVPRASPPTPAVAVPEGWRLMPKRLTEEMIAAAIAAHYGKKAMPHGMDITANGVNYSGAAAMRRFWKGLIAAAPQPPETRSYEEGKRVERLKAAIEGECDGLAIDDASAKVILTYLDTGDGPDDAIRSLANEPRHGE